MTSAAANTAKLALTVPLGLESPYKKYMLAVAAGLLNSSCCVVQLALNAVSIGCAGFAILDPLRPFFLALSVGGYVSSVAYAHQNGKKIFSLDNVITGLIIGSLSITPELVNLVNTRRLPLISPAPSVVKTKETFVLQVDGMKCVSCANKVKGALEQIGDCEAIVSQADSKAELICFRDGVTPEAVEAAVRDCTDPPGDFTAKVIEIKKEPHN